MRKARSPVVRIAIFLNHYYAHRFDRAIEVSREHIAMQPDFWLHHWGLALALCDAGRCDEVRAAARKARSPDRRL